VLGLFGQWLLLCSNAGSGTITSLTKQFRHTTDRLRASPRAHTRHHDSVVSPDGKFLYVESGGAGTVDVFAIGANALSLYVTTIFNIPVASEGIAIS